MQKKMFYCPTCESGVTEAMVMDQKSYVCTNTECKSMGPWALRKKNRKLDILDGTLDAND